MQRNATPRSVFQLNRNVAILSGNQGKNAVPRNATPRQFTLIFGYRCYQQVPLTDINEVYSNSRALNFYFNQKICYINPKKTFLALKVQCAKQDGSSILATDYVSCAPMKGQGMVDDVSVTIGTSYILYRSILINTGCNDRGGVPRVKHTILPSCISFGMDCT